MTYDAQRAEQLELCRLYHDLDEQEDLDETRDEIESSLTIITDPTS